MQEQMMRGAKNVYDAALRTTPMISDEIEKQLAELADLACTARTPAHRTYNGDLAYMEETEGGSRIDQECKAIAVGDAANHGLEEVGPEQIKLVARITLESAPLARFHVLTQLPPDGTKLRRSDLGQQVKAVSKGAVSSQGPLARALEELSELGLIDLTLTDSEHYCSLTKEAFSPLKHIPNHYLSTT